MPARVLAASLVFEAAANADEVGGRANPSAIHLSLRYYGYKSLMNPNVHYHRARFACVMLSRSLGFHITACSSPHDLVMMSRHGWHLNISAASTHPPIALAVDTCYQITFLSDDPAVTVRCVGETLHDDLRLEWNHAASAASVTATPISTTAAAASSCSSTFSTSSTWSASRTPHLSPYSGFGSAQQQPSHASAIKISCQNCRVAKAKCDEQRSGHAFILPATARRQHTLPQD